MNNFFVLFIHSRENGKSKICECVFKHILLDLIEHKIKATERERHNKYSPKKYISFIGAHM